MCLQEDASPPLLGASTLDSVLVSETCSFGSGQVNRQAQWQRRMKTPSVPETSAATMLIESR
jgi:hypothetical protein